MNILMASYVEEAEEFKSAYQILVQ